MSSLQPERITRAKEILQKIHLVPIATVNADGTPHNSPVFMVFDDQLNGYWASNQDAQHSQNIARTGQVFLVVFDSVEGHGGVFIRAYAEALEDTAKAHQALAVMVKVRGNAPGLGSVKNYTGDAGQRIYCARPLQAWINQSERDEHGAIIRDRRYEVSIQTLATI